MVDCSKFVTFFSIVTSYLILMMQLQLNLLGFQFPINKYIGGVNFQIRFVIYYCPINNSRAHRQHVISSFTSYPIPFPAVCLLMFFTVVIYQSKAISGDNALSLFLTKSCLNKANNKF